MLSSVLNSVRAVKVNIQIIRIFTRMREMLLNYKDLFIKLEQLEKKVTGHDEDIQVVFANLKKLLPTPNRHSQSPFHKPRPRPDRRPLSLRQPS